MLEPYLMFLAQNSTNVSSGYNNFSKFPRYAWGLGFQFGVKGGDSGAIFFDLSYARSIGRVIKDNGASWEPRESPYARFVISLGIGYKLGFMDRPGFEVDKEP